MSLCIVVRRARGGGGRIRRGRRPPRWRRHLPGCLRHGEGAGDGWEVGDVVVSVGAIIFVGEVEVVAEQTPCATMSRKRRSLGFLPWGIEWRCELGPQTTLSIWVDILPASSFVGTDDSPDVSTALLNVASDPTQRIAVRRPTTDDLSSVNTASRRPRITHVRLWKPTAAWTRHIAFPRARILQGFRLDVKRKDADTHQATDGIDVESTPRRQTCCLQRSIFHVANGRERVD